MIIRTAFRNFCRVMLVSSTSILPIFSQAQSGYTIIDLGTIGGSKSSGAAINASGQVAGDSDVVGNAHYHAFRYSGSSISDLGALGATSSEAYGINNSGQVTGESYLVGKYATHAVIWTGTTISDLGTLGGSYSYGRGINDRGQVAGYSQDRTDSGDFHAFRYSDGKMNALDELGGKKSYGFAINASGQIAGYSYPASNLAAIATIWNGTAITSLDTLGGSGSAAYGINDKGQVTGVANLAGGTLTHAVRWTGTKIQDLGTLDSPSSSSGSIGLSINLAGDVVGSSGIGGSVHAFVYSNGSMIDLNSRLPKRSGWMLTDAYGINDNGWITGQGQINGQAHAYLLRPNAVPEPSVTALFGIGTVAMGVELRRRKRRN